MSWRFAKNSAAAAVKVMQVDLKRREGRDFKGSWDFDDEDLIEAHLKVEVDRGKDLKEKDEGFFGKDEEK